MGAPMPMWSMCAENTTNSFFSLGSLPRSLAMMLADSTGCFSTFVLARTLVYSANVGSGAAGGCRHVSAEVESGKIVIILFREAQAVAHEHQRRVHRGSKINPGAEERVLAQHQRLGLAIAHHGGAGIFLHDLPRF